MNDKPKKLEIEFTSFEYAVLMDALNTAHSKYKNGSSLNNFPGKPWENIDALQNKIASAVEAQNP